MTMMQVVSMLLIVPLIATPLAAQTPEDERISTLAAYVEKIPVGSRVRVTLTDGTRLRGVLMLVDNGELVVRERKRLPEPPRHIPLLQVSDVEVQHDNGGGLAKAVAIAAGVAVAATLTVIAFLAAMLDD